MKTNKALAFTFKNDNSNNASTSNKNHYLSSDMEEMIIIFAGEINDIVEYDSFEYENSQKAIRISRGSQNAHRCHYKITLEKVELGKITLTRKEPFEEDELVIVEQALGALSLNLHKSNALLKAKSTDKPRLSEVL